MLAFETGGVEGLLCITRTIPTPQTTPTIHETILSFSTSSPPEYQTVARKIIEIAGTGERDPERICELILLALNESEERSA